MIFLWVTGRAMELGRECLKLWGYERVDEIIWVKTNQLQRIIRTGRTGHWLNHGKEHCLVGLKGNLVLNRGLDCDVIGTDTFMTDTVSFCLLYMVNIYQMKNHVIKVRPL